MPVVDGPDLDATEFATTPLSDGDGESISTEPTSPPASDPWDRILHALWEAWLDPVGCEEGLSTPPTKEAIQAAARWLQVLRKARTSPPTLITAEPGGGIIVEWATPQPGGEVSATLIFYNNGTAEFTQYHNNRVHRMEDWPFWPLHAR